MKIKVDPQAKRFYLAGEEWIPVVGHEKGSKYLPNMWGLFARN
ncbi:hypothetical protein [Halalkalibacterium halodurans]|nr:hypothetical protein [Halalkalibacterium halodurans]MDY7224639.1 hypothetical protein [Halalkalibacterium halodurans]MDY7243254.1 hypothetical protein [Halalkalibacterium halodurans]